jgi:tetratricopeptide (TPR) repeat protein
VRAFRDNGWIGPFPVTNAEGVNPARHEVEQQLARILADEVVASHPQPSKLFAFIVGRALDGEEITEKLIREWVFPNPPYKEDSNIARVTMDKVRKLLAEYYADEGEDDPVIIGLPQSPAGRRIKFAAGEAYSPHFSYNPRSAMAKEFAIANYLLRKGPSQILASLFRFAAITGHEPGHPDALLGCAEAVGSQLLLGFYPEDQHGKLIAGAFSLLADLDPDTWRIHMVSGLLYTCAGNLDAARGEFEIALNLDRQSTISRGWYVYFLFADGQQEEALRLVALVADEHTTNPQAHAAYGMYLFKSERFDEAERAYAQALALDRNCWIAHFGLTQLYASTAREERAREHSKRVEALLEPSEYEDMMRRLNLKPHEP